MESGLKIQLIVKNAKNYKRGGKWEKIKSDNWGSWWYLVAKTDYGESRVGAVKKINRPSKREFLIIGGMRFKT